AGDPAALALRRHPGLRHDGDDRRKAFGGRTDDARRLRPARLPDAALRLPDRPGGGRPDPRAGGGKPVPPRHVDQPGRSHGPADQSDLGDAARHRPRGADRAVRAARHGAFSRQRGL
ncbi:MAG: Tripartite tricarboxylate transporter TctA family, partial [uncultured Microvirga sp.]